MRTFLTAYASVVYQLMAMSTTAIATAFAVAFVVAATASTAAAVATASVSAHLIDEVLYSSLVAGRISVTVPSKIKSFPA